MFSSKMFLFKFSGDRPSGVGPEFARDNKQHCDVINLCRAKLNACPENSECIFLGVAVDPPIKCKVLGC